MGILCFFSFIVRLNPCLMQVISLNVLKSEIEKMRTEIYSQENTEHEQMLMKVQEDGSMDGWMDKWTDRWMDGWMDEWMDGWMDGSMDGMNNIDRDR